MEVNSKIWHTPIKNHQGNTHINKMAVVDKMTTAYCVKCRQKRTIKNPKAITMKNGRKATKGTCPECGTNVFRIGG